MPDEPKIPKIYNIPIDIDKYTEFVKNELQTYFRMPKDFKTNDPKRVDIFCKRMKLIRLKRLKEYIEGIEKDKKAYDGYTYTQKYLADFLGVTKMSVSKYESFDEKTGKAQKIKKIPFDKIPGIIKAYDISPHYLFGYVDGEWDVLQFDENNDVIKNEDGSNVSLTLPMAYDSLYEVQCLITYKNLVFKDVELYNLINRILKADCRTQMLCKKILDSIFENTKFMQIDDKEI